MAEQRAEAANALVPAHGQSTEMDHLAVQENLQLALEVAFDRWGRRWLCAVLLLGFGMFCMILWSQVVLEEHKMDKCDQPLAMMLRLLYIAVAVMVFQREIITHCLCYSAPRDTPGPAPIPPCRVTAFRRISLSATILWPMVAAAMLWQSKECSIELKHAVAAITVYFAIGALVVFVAPACCVSMVLCLIRRGITLARASSGDPGLIERLPGVDYDPALFSTDPGPGTFAAQCSICLDGFDGERPIKRTYCQPMPHAFHQDCLTGWLAYATTCPLCRSDLAVGPDAV